MVTERERGSLPDLDEEIDCHTAQTLFPFIHSRIEGREAGREVEGEIDGWNGERHDLMKGRGSYSTLFLPLLVHCLAQPNCTCCCDNMQLYCPEQKCKITN